MRTTNSRWFRLLTAAAAIAAPSVASAQAAVKPISFGVQAGFTVPTGDFGDYGESGWNVGGYLQWRPENQVFGLRGELQYHRNDIKEEVLPSGVTGNFGILYAGVAPILEVSPAGSTLGWYILAGAGLYQVEIGADAFGSGASESESKFGFNAGAGLKFRFGSAKLYVETRYHGVEVEDFNFTFMPFSVGISW